MSKKGKVKKSDQKQFENAWDNFYDSIRSLMNALGEIEEFDDKDFSVDDLNQISGRINKLTKTISKIGESIN